MSFIRATRPGCNLGRVRFFEEGEGGGRGLQGVGLSGKPSLTSRMRAARRATVGVEGTQGLRAIPLRTSLIKETLRGGGTGRQALWRREEGEASRISRMREDRRDSTGRERSHGLRAIPLRTSLIKETERGPGTGIVGLREKPCSTSCIKANLP
jgi:hypothetical protein